MDTQIWYALFSTLIGGIYGAYRRLGEVSNIFMYFASLHNVMDHYLSHEELILDSLVNKIR